MWRRKLRSYFKNTRFRKCKHLREVQRRQAKLSKIERPITPPNNHLGVANFLPDTPEGEDTRTVNLHKERLLNQSSLSVVRQDRSTIETLDGKNFFC